MEFKDLNENLNYIEQQLHGDPCINVIDKEDFEIRVTKVFHILWEKLSKSFGPGGAGTFISVYPSYYNTKDGFTIMKNIAFDKKIDQVISDMVQDICNRLNFTVGDGTTSATIATKSTYESYLEHKKFFEEQHILPRNILTIFEKLKNEIIRRLEERAIPIRSDDPKELRNNIEKVVYISSNGNREITDIIASLYEELMYPAISCTLSNDGTMKSSIVEGYKLDITLTDKIYINNDNNTMLLNGADVLMFSHKVTKDTYEKILKPLSDACRQRGRHLVCIAPFYDETALSGVIKTDLNMEYKKTHDINLVLMACTKATGHAKILLEDLAMLLNTIVITPSMENEILSRLNGERNIYHEFDLDNRNIDGMNVAVWNPDGTLSLSTYNKDLQNIFDVSKDAFRVGYADKMVLGLKESTFSGFYYNQETYDKYVSVATDELEEVRKKCEKIGTFSMDLMHKQQRLYGLGLKTGLIEVGSTSEISQSYLKDSVDDAVKAAASAYNNGIILGCNVTLMRIMDEMLEEIPDENYVEKTLLVILRNGFKYVYKTVLSNVYKNEELTETNVIEVEKEFYETMHLDSVFEKSALEDLFSIIKPPTNAFDLMIEYSIHTNSVFDIETETFNGNVINSAETDKEILKATIDLLSLLITGNQLVLC